MWKELSFPESKGSDDPTTCLAERAVKVAYVYLIRSLETKKFYVGWTTDITRRLNEHNQGKSYYTKYRGPWELIGYETFADLEAAKERERVLKRNPRTLYYFKKRALTSLKNSRRLEAANKQVVG